MRRASRTVHRQEKPSRAAGVFVGCTEMIDANRRGVACPLGRAVHKPREPEDGEAPTNMSHHGSEANRSNDRFIVCVDLNSAQTSDRMVVTASTHRRTDASGGRSTDRCCDALAICEDAGNASDRGRTPADRFNHRGPHTPGPSRGKTATRRERCRNTTRRARTVGPSD